ncbi:winged helix DNA-binding domain-containing protein [Cryptosporangium minutisporangium]|uniref:Winged helix DNA-binding domain-containing protein n=1 Tax=Cryptosporangium minutisporangium TaxID=113569 RepID=A0ABP6ST02_9ACTN
MREITTEERRRRLGVRHALASSARVADPVAAATAVVALHATDAPTVFLAVRARADPAPPAVVEDALYVQRSLVRMLGMRRTMFVVPSPMLPIVEASTMQRVAAAQRRLLLKHLREAGVPDTERWLTDVEAGTLAALAARGGAATANELSADEPRLRTALLMAPGKPYQARTTITTRVLTVLGADGRIVRGRPTGSWLSQRYRWALAEQWLPVPLDRPSETEARAVLAREWLAAYGPAPASDLQWWTGWTGAQVKRALADAKAVPVRLADGGSAVVLPDDLDPTADPGPWAAFLPALDPTTMGWAERSWYLGSYGPLLFDRAGNAGPTLWLNGRIVGGWAQRPDGAVAVRLFEDVGTEGRALVDAEAGRLTRWLAEVGDVRVVPRFRTPVERELST